VPLRRFCFDLVLSWLGWGISRNGKKSTCSRVGGRPVAMEGSAFPRDTGRHGGENLDDASRAKIISFL